MIKTQCRACGHDGNWCSVYTSCPLNKGKKHDMKVISVFVEVSAEDYEKLKRLGSHEWMTVRGDEPLSAEQVVNRLIEKEYKQAFPTDYR